MPTIHPTLDSAAATRVETVTFDSKRYRIERTAGCGRGTVVERWLGIGVVGGIRAWRGHSWAESVRWYAAVNPTGEPFQATVRADGFASRWAAVRWLLANAGAAGGQPSSV